MRSLTHFLLALCLFGTSATAFAIPSFSRRYHTSCSTCHTAFPKLNPFGEAFRRNNYRFPGDDADAVKYNQLPLGAEANKEVFPQAIWPDAIPEWVPLSVGVIGSATVALPNTAASYAATGNGTTGNPGNAVFNMDSLAAEFHLWAGGAFDNQISYFTELTFASDGTFSIEHAIIMFNDLMRGVLGQHTLNLLIGQNTPNVTSFGIHSSYTVDPWITPVAVDTLFAGNGSFAPGTNELITLELNGVVAHRVDYNFGFSNGTNDIGGFYPPNNLYGHIGFKLGGLSLDGETGSTGSSKPWEENAVTVDAWIYQSLSYYLNDQLQNWSDSATTYAGDVRGQLASAELDVGFLAQHHDHPDSSGAEAWGDTMFTELSYVIWPWLIPAVRVEYTWVRAPNDPLFVATAPSNGNATLLRLIPAVNFLIRPNIRLALLADFESVQGAPPGGWGGAGGIYGVPPNVYANEWETFSANLLYAF
jgi:hypothetical protein